MKALREVLEEKNFDFVIAKSGRNTLNEALEKHIPPMIEKEQVPLKWIENVRAIQEVTRKAEVARIAEALFIAASGADKNRSIGNDALADFAFNDAEAFVAYKETLK